MKKKILSENKNKLKQFRVRSLWTQRSFFKFLNFCWQKDDNILHELEWNTKFSKGLSNFQSKQKIHVVLYVMFLVSVCIRWNVVRNCFLLETFEVQKTDQKMHPKHLNRKINVFRICFSSVCVYIPIYINEYMQQVM